MSYACPIRRNTYLGIKRIWISKRTINNIQGPKKVWILKNSI